MTWEALIPLAAGALNFLGGERRNDAQAELSQAQMDFQERMSSTAHQREVKDLLAAGLNPMLSGKYGGSSTPPGSQATVENTMGGAVNSATQAALLKSQIDNMRAQTEKTLTDVKVSEATERNVNAQTMSAYEGLRLIDQNVATGVEAANELRSRQGVQEQTINNLQAQTDRIFEQNQLTRTEVLHIKELIKNAIEQNHLIRADVENRKIQTAVHQVNKILLELDIPKARNEAAAEASDWKKNVAPYLIDAQRIGGTASSLGLRPDRFRHWPGMRP